MLAALAVLMIGLGGWRFGWFGVAADSRPAASSRSPLIPQAPRPASPLTPSASPSPSPSPEEPSPEPINAGFPGLTTFRGNATRTYHGEGPAPKDPEVLWRYPSSGGMCRSSSNLGETKVWCGMGWTGQPNVVENERGRIELRFGAYDGGVHMVKATTGKQIKETFQTGDIIKGTVTSDPDGFPLLYSGSRDNYWRVLALDRGRQMEELWSIHADHAPNRVWNDDWDSSALIVDDYALVGGENSWFYVIKLNRDYDDRGKVTVRPEVRMEVPGYDDELMADLPDDNVSIEGSPSLHDGVVYFANSGGLVQGWDVSDVLAGGTEHERVFRFWTGDDTDASVVIDDEGHLYVATEDERSLSRADEVGQLMKLDPGRPKDPLVWSIQVPGGGIWATPALYRNALYVTTNSGELVGVRRRTGKVAWRVKMPGPTWSSPAVVDDTLVVGDCNGVLHAFDVRRPFKRPRELWTVQLEGCIEATPAVWKGMVYVGARGGAIYGIGDP